MSVAELIKVLEKTEPGFERAVDFITAAPAAATVVVKKEDPEEKAEPELERTANIITATPAAADVKEEKKEDREEKAKEHGEETKEKDT